MKRPRYLKAAEAHLTAADPAMAQLVASVGRCTLRSEPDLFRSLMYIVISQQIATKAARAIAARFDKAFARGLSHRSVLRATEDKLRGCGLSGPKQRALRAVAAAFADKLIDPLRIPRFSDEEVAEVLLQIKGIGPWSVDMVLMFTLARPDVLPVGDLGLRSAARDVYGLSELPDPDTLKKLAEPWRPYRTIASWYLWRSKGPVPQS